MGNVVAYFLALAAVGLFASVRGGGPERASIAIIAASSLIDLSINLAAARATALPMTLALDLLTTLTVIGVALRAERYWTMVLAGLLIVGVELQIGTLLAPVQHRMIYKIAHAFSAYPMLLLIAIGVVRHRQRARFAPDLDWTRLPRK